MFKKCKQGGANSQDPDVAREVTGECEGEGVMMWHLLQCNSGAVA